MKKKFLSTLSFLWKISIPLLSAIIGLKVVEQFNFIQAFGIITDVDKAFDICKYVFRMYDTDEPVSVQLYCHVSVMKYLIDNFGTDFESETVDRCLFKMI